MATDPARRSVPGRPRGQVDRHIRVVEAHQHSLSRSARVSRRAGRSPAQDRQRPRRTGPPGPGEQAASEFRVLVQDADHQLLGDQVGLQPSDPCGGAAAAEAVPVAMSWVRQACIAAFQGTELPRPEQASRRTKA